MGEGILPDGNLPGGEGRFQPLLYNKMGTGEGRFQMNEQLFLAYRNAQWATPIISSLPLPHSFHEPGGGWMDPMLSFFTALCRG